MSSTAARETFQPGLRIGDYRVERELRADDTGLIYEAVHLVLPRRAALKIAHPMFTRAAAVQMMREACVLEALAHPGVSRVYECGMLPDKRPWVARELLEGASLAETMQAGSVAVADLVVMLRSVADILEHAHGRGVLHHQLGEAAIVHTPARAFPYCVRGWADVVVHDSERGGDASSDIHALGALTFRALTGSPLTPGASAQASCPAAPSELTALVDLMLNYDPRHRPSATEVRQRAAWISETLELVSPHARWTPPYGIQEPQLPEADSPNDLIIRIRL
jgi:serine/threonine protein kinase